MNRKGMLLPLLRAAGQGPDAPPTRLHVADASRGVWESAASCHPVAGPPALASPSTTTSPAHNRHLPLKQSDRHAAEFSQFRILQIVAAGFFHGVADFVVCDFPFHDVAEVEAEIVGELEQENGHSGDFGSDLLAA